MKQYRSYLAIAILLLASLACQAVAGTDGTPTLAPLDNDTENSETTQPAPTVPTEVSTEAGNPDNTTNTDFPVTADAFNITEVSGSLIFYTKLSAEDAMNFYRDEYTSRGYTEREILTIVSDGTFSMVFHGDPSGKAVVIQSVDLGDGSRTITIRLEDV